MMVIEEIKTGNHTGAIQGLGIKNSTSVVVNLGDQLINTYNHQKPITK